MLYSLVGFLALAYGSIVPQDEYEYVSTPIGYRPKQCVHTPEETNHIIDVSNEDIGITVYYPDSNRSVFHPTLPECVENAKLIMEGLEKKKLVAQKLSKILPAQYGNLGDGWQIYGGWYPPSLMGNFTVSYTLPDQDMTDYGQIMYYFIGMQNNRDRQTTTIIQPVITYCNSGCDPISAKPGWSGTSWNCCSGGQSWFAKPIALGEGDSNVMGWVYSDNTSGNVQVYTEYQGDSSVLNLSGDTRQYDWCDVTLEAYNYGTHCDAFNTDPFAFNSMTITDASGDVLTNPDWDLVNNDICKGSITFTSNGLAATIVGDGE